MTDSDLGRAHVSMMTAHGRSLRIAHWRATEPTDALPLLLFNGIGASIELVVPFAEKMTNRDLIIFDMPGVGGSPDPVVPYNAVTMALATTDLLDQMQIPQADVMGVSWGGAMAQHFAMQHPSRVGRLILAATSAGWIMVPGKLSSLTKMANPRRYIDPDFMAKNFATLYGGDMHGADGHVTRLRPPSGIGYAYQLLAMLGWTSAPFLPFLVKADTLVMMGDRDNLVPLGNGKILASLIPGAELSIIENGGHLFLVSHADECLKRIDEFLGRPRDLRAAA